MRHGVIFCQAERPTFFPGDALAVNVPSQNAAFSAIVRTVSIDVVDPADDRGMYTIEFANDLAVPLAMQDGLSASAIPVQEIWCGFRRRRLGRTICRT